MVDEQANPIAPNAVEAEEAVLGSVLINPVSIATLYGFLSPEDFFILRNQWIWEAMLAINERGEEIDNITLAHELRAQSRLDEIGGTAYITRLINATATHIHAETYARLVERAAVRRRMLLAVAEIGRLALEENDTIEHLAQRSHDLLTEATKFKSDGGWKFVSEFSSSNYDKVVARFNEKGEPVGLPTGLTDLDNALELRGWGDGELIYVAGRPGMGKSAFVLNAAVKAAKLGKHVAYISREMSGESLQFRMLSAESGIPKEKLRRADLTEGELDRFTEATARLSKLPIAIDDLGLGTIRLIENNVKRLHREWHVDLLVIDYLQLLTIGGKAENRQNEVSAISRRLKFLATTLKIPVLVPCQINRDAEGRKDHRPILSDLRESGSLEQDADVVIFIYRDEYYDAGTADYGKAELIIAKQREGISSGSEPVMVRWIGATQRFSDLSIDKQVTNFFSSWNGGK